MENPISRTAYYTLSVRAWDAKQPKPLCGDNLAETFMNDDARKVWKEFKDELRPNTSNAARHHIIDRALQDALKAADGLKSTKLPLSISRIGCCLQQKHRIR